MPFGGGRTQTVNVSGLIWDANLIVPAGNIIQVDHIAETTGGHGIVHNMNCIVDAAAGLQSNHVTEVTGGHGVTVAAGIVLNVDHIGEATGGHNIVVNSILEAPAVAIRTVQLNADHIAEITGGHNIVLNNPVIYDGMMINVISGTGFNPLDSSNYYFGGNPAVGPATVALLQRIYFAKAAVIRRADINWYEGTVVGTNENISIYIRLNDTTDTLIQTVGAAAASKIFTNAALTIAIAAGDYIEIKIVTPAWVTNPTNVCVGGVIYAG